MNDILSILLLLSAPVLPLLLALPIFRSLIPWRGLYILALLPATILVIFPTGFSTELNWVLLNSELGISQGSQLLLGISVLIWAWIMTLSPLAQNPPKNKYFKVFLLITMAGNFGAIISLDMVSFFIFSSLLGYGFYAILASTSDKPVEKRIGILYIALLIVADIMLLEVLLISYITSGVTSFETVHQAIVYSDYKSLYLSLIMIAFIIKAGIWPFHFWLIHAFRHLTPVMSLLLYSVPVTIAMLGILRWLPLGKVSSPEIGFAVQAVGVITVLYAAIATVIKLLKRTPPQELYVYGLLLLSGTFITIIGTELAYVNIWNIYSNWLYYFVTLIAASLAILLIATGWINNNPTPENSSKIVPTTWFERWPASIVSWGANIGFNTLPKWNNWCINKIKQPFLFMLSQQDKLGYYEKTLQTWSIAITLFLLLAMIFISVITFIR